MISLQSFQERLTSELQRIEAAILDLWHKSRIEEFRNDPYSELVFIAPPHYWKALPIEHRAAQARLLGRYRHWYELFYRCHAQHSSDMQDNLDQTNAHVLAAIELKSDWSTAATFEENHTVLSDKLNFFRSLLEQHFGDEMEFLLVPDTNALLKAADPAQYVDVIDSASFTFVIVPTVLAELDGLKRSRANQAVGDKAEKAIRTIKGLRKQGSVLEGVIVAKTITVKMIPTEPRMADLPSWLDPTNQDDRIIGSVLEIQSAHPSTVVVLVTDDMNLQNKAEMAFLPWAEPPELAAKTMASP
jgi:rRNA-processing protein FCF1